MVPECRTDVADLRHLHPLFTHVQADQIRIAVFNRSGSQFGRLVLMANEAALSALVLSLCRSIVNHVG